MLASLAVVVSVTATVVAMARTSIRCPHGGFLYAKVGAWVANVQPLPHGNAPCTRGDVLPCHCVRCKGRWYSVVSYPR